jgi:hypothetical protein
MKYKIILTFAMCIIASTTKIYSSTSKVGDGFENVVDKFINSIVTSNWQELNGVLDKNLRFKVTHLDRLMIFDKSTILDDLKSRNGRRQDYEPSYLVLAQSDAVALVQIDFTYGDTIMQNFIVLEKNCKKEWKITQVYELFKAIDKPYLKDDLTVTK